MTIDGPSEAAARPSGPLCIVAGHSHITAFGSPLLGLAGEPTFRDVGHCSGRFRVLVGSFPRKQIYWNMVERHAEGNFIALFWFGNQHLAKYLVDPDEPFDFVLSSEPELPVDESVAIVPEAAVQESFAPSLKGLDELVELIKQKHGRPIICGTPPPRGNDEAVWELVGQKVAAKEYGPLPVRPLSKMRLSPRLLRYKLWAVIQSMLRERAMTHTVPFLPVPRFTQTDAGFLREEYAADITHANDAYGALVVNDIWTRFLRDPLEA